MKKDFIEILYENRKLCIVIFILLIISTLVGVYFFVNKKPVEVVQNEVTIDLRLFGSNEITLKHGEEYEEIGYYAIDSNGVIRTNEVRVINNVDSNNAGIYRVTYQIADIIKTRIVIVLEKEDDSYSDDSLSLKLIGDSVINLSIGDNYIEPGFEAISKNGENLNDKVVVSGEVDTNSPGTYTIIYEIEDSGEIKQVIRTVVVLNDNLNFSITSSTNSYTNNSVILNIKIIGDNFSGLTLPNMVYTELNNTTYTIDKNGTYTFIAYNKNGKSFSKTITINNIDKNIPSASCTAIIDENDTTKITISASDNESGIKNYEYYDNNKLLITSNNNFYDYLGKVSNNVSVKVYDKASNYREVSCNIIDNSIPDRSKNKFILIGDSRTEDMCKSSYCNACTSDKYFAKVSMGYSWFVNTAIPNTNTYLNNNPNTSYNIFILLGVNDNGASTSAGTSSANKYFDKVKSLATGSWKNHYIYYVSVNPVINSSGKRAAINGFNSNMKTKIANSGIKNLKYCDTASKLSITSSNSPDGVHYNCTTYRKIRSLLNDCL